MQRPSTVMGRQAKAKSRSALYGSVSSRPGYAAASSARDEIQTGSPRVTTSAAGIVPAGRSTGMVPTRVTKAAECGVDGTQLAPCVVEQPQAPVERVDRGAPAVHHRGRDVVPRQRVREGRRDLEQAAGALGAAPLEGERGLLRALELGDVGEDADRALELPVAPADGRGAREDDRPRPVEPLDGHVLGIDRLAAPERAGHRPVLRRERPAVRVEGAVAAPVGDARHHGARSSPDPLGGPVEGEVPGGVAGDHPVRGLLEERVDEPPIALRAGAQVMELGEERAQRAREILRTSLADGPLAGFVVLRHGSRPGRAAVPGPPGARAPEQ